MVGELARFYMIDSKSGNFYNGHVAILQLYVLMRNVSLSIPSLQIYINTTIAVSIREATRSFYPFLTLFLFLLVT